MTTARTLPRPLLHLTHTGGTYYNSRIRRKSTVCGFVGRDRSLQNCWSTEYLLQGPAFLTTTIKLLQVQCILACKLFANNPLMLRVVASQAKSRRIPRLLPQCIPGISTDSKLKCCSPPLPQQPSYWIDPGPNHLCISKQHCFCLPQFVLSSIFSTHIWLVNMSDARYCVEYAKTGRSGCKKCKLSIEKGVGRIGKITTNPFSDDGGEMKVWYHLRCIFETLKVNFSPVTSVDANYFNIVMSVGSSRFTVGFN